MSTEQYYHLIFKKLNKGLDAEEAQSLEKWLAEAAENQRAADEIQYLMSLDKADVPTVDVPQELLALKARLREENQALGVPASPRLLFSRKWWVAAASIALLAIALVFFQKTEKKASEWVSVPSAEQNETSVLLPDGSRVWLRQNSLVAYEKDFAASGFRRLRLQGEAFFEVKKDETKPFVVETAACTVQVLGTSFDIRARDKEAETFVAVKTGKVRVSSAQAQTALNPGEKAIVNKQSGAIRVAAEDAAQVAQWRAADLEYRNLALTDALQRLSHRFEVPILLDNPDLARCPYSIYLPKADLSAVLTNIKAVFGVSITQTSKGYRLADGKCPN